MPSPAPLLALALALAAALAAAGCSTTKNPSFCCTTAADCEQFGVTDGPRTCATGTSCVGNTCVLSSCERQGCTAEAPICDPSTDTCRGCRLDTECDSGACGDDGACVDESRVVYLDPSGTDTPPCSRAAPCKELQFAVQQTTPQRDHIVMANGTYAASRWVRIDTQSTSALALWIHGGGSRFYGGGSDGFFSVGVSSTIRDLELENVDPVEGFSLSAAGPAVLERVILRGPTGLGCSGTVRLRDVEIRARNVGIQSSGALVVERARVIGGTVGVRATGGSIDVNNLLVSGTTGIGIELTNTRGALAFTTVADTGIGGVAPLGVKCTASPVTIRSSIIWTPASTTLAAYEGFCTLVSSIIGPVGVVGASNADPVFVDLERGDFHLQPASPARDAADAGPAFDFEGDPRPRGARFDLGADETP